MANSKKTIIVLANGERYFLIADRLCHEDEFISAAGVRLGGPGAEFASRMYCCLFNALTNISSDYERYYKVEYNDIWDYVERNYLTDLHLRLDRTRSTDTGIMRNLKQVLSPGMQLFHGDATSGGDLVVGQYIISDEGFSIIQKILARVAKERKK